MNGGKKGEFAAILNECVKKCSDSKEDYRYVKVCAEFAEFCKSPLEFLAWMEQSNIGVRFSLFWETKARLLEDMARDTAAADAAFAEGIRRGAQPIDRLHTKRKEMQGRVASRLAKPGATDEEEEEQRMALGALTKADGARTTRVGPGQLKMQGSVAPPSNLRRPNTLSVYDGADERDPAAVPGREWIDYGSEREAVKENKDVAKQWSRTTLPQHGVTSTGAAPQRPGFDIFDEAKGEDEIAPIPAPAVSKKPVAAAPIVVKRDPAPTPVMPAAVAPPSPITKKKVRAGFNEAALLGESLSFEELRAMQWANRAEEELKQRLKREAEERQKRQQAEQKARDEEMLKVQEDLQRVIREGNNRKIKPIPKQQPPTRNMLQMSFAVENTTLDTMNYEALVRGSAKTGNMDALDDLRNVYADTIDFENHGKAGKSFMLREPTVNTRAVMDEVERMFNENVAFDDSIPTGPISSRSFVSVAPPPGFNKKPSQFDVYEDEDSLESFRASMNASAALAAPVSSSKPAAAPAKFEVLEDSFVAPLAKAEDKRKKPVASKLEVFEDEPVQKPALKKPVASKLEVFEDEPMQKPALKKPVASKLEVFEDEPVQKPALKKPVASKLEVFEDEPMQKPALKKPVASKLEVFEDEPMQKPALKKPVASKLEVFEDEPVQKPALKKPVASKLEVFEDEPVQKPALKKPVASKLEVFEDEPMQKPAPPAGKPSGPVDPWAVCASALVPSKFTSIPGFHDHGSNQPRFEDDGKYFWLGEAVYDLLQIGGGVCSNVYRGEDVSGSEDESICAIKLFKPANAWEFFVTSQLQKRCSKEQLRHFPRVLSYHQFAGQSALLTVFNENGTVASLIEAWKSKQNGVPEELAIFYAVELLRAVEALHAARILHNDISPENVLVVMDSSNAPDRQTLQLVDFSCSVDLSDMGDDAVFVGAGRCSVQCQAMRKREAWTFGQDHFGIANLVHWLVFGEPISSISQTGSVAPVKSGWQTELWSDFFAALLNPAPTLTAGQFGESVSKLKQIRIKLETYRLQISNLVQKLLGKQAILLFERKQN
jgi:hypothetical protein